MFAVITVALAAGSACPLALEPLFEAYVEARGGESALAAQEGLRIVSTQYEGNYQPEFDYRVRKPGYMWIRATYRDGYVYTEGFDGTSGWEQPGATAPAEYVDGDAGRALNQGAMSPVHLYGLHDMADLGAEVTLSGCSRIGQTDYYVVNVISGFGTNIDYYINAETYRLERGRSHRPLHPTADPTRITIEERWGDFRWVDGVLHPFSYSNWNVETGERLNHLVVHTIERRDDFTPGDFAHPAGE